MRLHLHVTLKHIGYLSAALLLAPLAQAQISLGTAVDLALRQSTQVRIAQADVRKAAAELATTRSVYVPTFALGSSVGPPTIGFPTGQPSIFSATLNSMVLSFPQSDYIHAAQHGLLAAQAALEDAREQAALDASSDYVELDATMHELAALDEQMAAATKLVAIEQQRAEAGVDSRSDLLQAELTAAQIKLRHIHLESTAASLRQKLSSLTGLPASTMRTETASIPEIPALHADEQTELPGLEAVDEQAKSSQLMAQGDSRSVFLPTIAFGAQYNRDSYTLSNYKQYYLNPKTDNFSAGFSISIPIFDYSHTTKKHKSAAEALRATLEAEQAKHQNEEQIALLNGNLRELDAESEVASLKQQIAAEQVKSVDLELTGGNGAPASNAPNPQLNPKNAELARIDERQKFTDSLDATLSLNKTRLALMRALGHMEDWVRSLPEASADVPKSNLSASKKH